MLAFHMQKAQAWRTVKTLDQPQGGQVAQPYFWGLPRSGRKYGEGFAPTIFSGQAENVRVAPSRPSAVSGQSTSPEGIRRGCRALPGSGHAS